MKVFIANYYWHGRYGAFHSIDTVVVAETKDVALGLLLESYNFSTKEDWTIYEINLNEASVYHINEEER